MVTAQEIRERFLKFFQERGHQIAPSGPLIPPADPTLLFTNAGMVQFKDLFLGKEKRSYSRAATCQKCLRVSGKHNDLENVGRTARHHTFFEMLGNFSFGDYFKKDAIKWAWEFVTQELKLPADKLWATVYKEDDDAYNIWREEIGLPENHIVRMGERDNFWSMGDTGPCGPCSEIYIDQGEDMACGENCGIGKCDCDRFLEIWNLVFTQFDQDGSGARTLLAAPNIDTGMGLERIAAICQGKRSNFDCDLFQQIIQYAANLANVSYSASAPDANDIDTALRVIADHARAAAFLLAEGILPSNENRGYVLRRLIRRALRFAELMGVHEPFLHKVTRKTTEVMGDAYPELKERADFIEKAVFEEEQRFSLTLANGLGLLDEELQRLEAAGEKTISGYFCFRLYDTYGFPLDIVNDIAAKRNFEVDGPGFEARMREQRERARASQKKSGLLGHGDAIELGAVCRELAAKGIKSEFVGYETLKARSSILALLDLAGTPVRQLGEGGKGYAVTGVTPFYAESGGQTGDRGIISSTSGQARVVNTSRPDPGIILMEIEMEKGELAADQEAELTVDGNLRQAVARNHTCTHLLHAALRRALGSHVHQAGSHVDAGRLRFDFAHFSALSAEELAAVERDVNRAILADFQVHAEERDREEALAAGAMALFSEKYGEKVRVLTVDGEDEPESVELCGGTHLSRTGQAGSFYIISESAVAAGVRRIEAATGWNAYNFAIQQRSRTQEAAAALKTGPAQLAEKARQLQDELKKLRRTQSAAPKSAEVLKAVKEQIGGIAFLAEKLDGVGMKGLRELMDKLRASHVTKSVIFLAGAEDGKIALLLYVSKDLHDRFTAPDLIREAAAVCGGSGGGRPDLAQAGGSSPAAVAEAFEVVKKRLGEK